MLTIFGKNVTEKVRN